MKLASVLFLIILLGSCKGPSGNSESVLARVYDDYLYESEVKGIIPEGTHGRDSVNIVKNYIASWVSQRLFLHKAEKNLTKNDLDFEKQLDDYRNSLIIYEYESKLIEQNLDTVVKVTDIEKYYNNNQQNFQLKNDIIKTYYARFESTLPVMSKVRNYFYSEKPESRDSLEAYIKKYSNMYFINDEIWILFNDLIRFVPLQTYNQEAYLKNHRKIELEDERYIYFINFVDYRIKDGISPMSFESENIRQIILNKRKIKIIEDMRNEVYQAALDQSDFEIY